MMFVKTELIRYKQYDKKRSSQPKRQPENINPRVNFVVHKVAKSDFEVIVKHVFGCWLLAIGCYLIILSMTEHSGLNWFDSAHHDISFKIHSFTVPRRLIQSFKIQGCENRF